MGKTGKTVEKRSKRQTDGKRNVEVEQSRKNEIVQDRKERGDMNDEGRCLRVS